VSVSGQTRCYRQSLRIHPDRESRSRTVKTSIFGYTLSERSVFVASNAFESWKHWSKASNIFYKCTVEDSGDDDDDDDDANDDDDDDDGMDHPEYINGPYFLRAAKLWSTLNQWCMSNQSGTFGNLIHDTFEPGVNRKRGRFANCAANIGSAAHSHAHAFEAIFAFCDGQTKILPIRAGRRRPTGADADQVALGLFGGYRVYDHEQCTRLCVTKDALEIGLGNYAVISGNFLSERFRGIAMDHQGGLHILTVENGSIYFSPAFESSSSASGRAKNDIGLLWMEEYARRLESAELNVRSVKFEDGVPRDVISPFPSGNSPLASRKVTRGVEVVASSVGAFEIMTVVYSLRIRILTEGEEGYMTVAERGFDTCQLSTRHWKLVESNQGQVDNVHGEGVVGRYPLLREGGYRDDTSNAMNVIEAGSREAGTFHYQSCASFPSGTFEGRIKFIPGSINEPEGESFFVEVGRFALELEPYAIY